MITARRGATLNKPSRPGAVQVQLVRYTLFNDCSDQCATGAQPALSLRLGPQVQTLLSREGRRTGGCRPGQSRRGSGCSIARGGHVGSHTNTKAPDAPALEGDHFSWLRPAHADATQGRWQLSEAIPPNPLTLNPRARSLLLAPRGPMRPRQGRKSDPVLTAVALPGNRTALALVASGNVADQVFEDRAPPGRV